jgi:hypothetical protein
MVIIIIIIKFVLKKSEQKPISDRSDRSNEVF